MQRRNYDSALGSFAEAHKVCLRNREIVFYKSSAMVATYLESAEKPHPAPNWAETRLKSIQAEYDAGIKAQKNDHFLHFYRGLIVLYMRDFPNAFNDLDHAVRTDEEANAKYHMYRGLAYACMSMFKEAVTDLSAAIKLKDDYLLAYYNRGKCAYLLGDTDLAFSDFQKLLVLRPVPGYMRNG